VEILDVTLVGINAENGRKLLLTVLALAVLWLAGRALTAALSAALAGRGGRSDRALFWARQGVKLAAALLMLLAVVSIWFDDPVRLATGLGLVTAGLAFALQKLVAAVAGYFVILRGQTFNVGDRITMGGVRGDVIGLSFTQTTIMEMGQPPAVQQADPAMWVRSRQYTGRIVTVSTARVFDEPVYNYTREFPFIWEEMSVPVPHRCDHRAAEAILLEAARRHTVAVSSLGEEALREMERRYFVKAADMEPAVFYRLTDDWLELTVRFIAPTHAIRELKDRMSRDILGRLEEARIDIASRTLAVVGLPAVRVEPAVGADGRALESP
jgi:small-conductance mechanosensitive channel